MRNFGTKIVLPTLFLIFLLVESTLLPFPFVVLLSLLSFMFTQDEWVIIVIFLASLALDALRVYDFGITPLFVFAILALITIFHNILNLSNYKVLVAGAFASSLLYAYLVSYTFNPVAYIVVIAGGVFVMAILRRKQSWLSNI